MGKKSRVNITIRELEVTALSKQNELSRLGQILAL